MKIRPVAVLLILGFVCPDLFSQNSQGPSSPKNVEDGQSKSGPQVMQLYDVPAAPEAETQVTAEVAEYLNITQSKEPTERTKLIENFLQKYPESKYAPTLHQVATSLYQQLNNREKMIEHGEKTLLAFPSNPAILSLLGLAYTSGGEPDKAIDRASKAIATIEKLTPPANADQARWKNERDQFLAMNYASMGSSYLTKYELERKAQKESKPTPQAQGESVAPLKDVSEKKENEPQAKGASNQTPGAGAADLAKAAEYLSKAVELTPQYDYAQFQLGVVSAYQNQSGKAMDAFAKTVALEGNFKDIARKNLEAIYKVTHKDSLDGLDQVVSKAKEELAPRKPEPQKPEPQKPEPPPAEPQ
jgi:tetratricopeptide (TPR) repeat protein